MNYDRMLLRTERDSSYCSHTQILEGSEEEAVCVLAPVWYEDIRCVKIDRVEREEMDEFSDTDLFT